MALRTEVKIVVIREEKEITAFYGYSTNLLLATIAGLAEAENAEYIQEGDQLYIAHVREFSA